jgi:hypothetical protein
MRDAQKRRYNARLRHAATTVLDCLRFNPGVIVIRLRLRLVLVLVLVLL